MNRCSPAPIDRLELLAGGLRVCARRRASFVVALTRGMPEAEVRALAFFSLVLAIVSLIFVNRSFSASLITALRRPNRALATGPPCCHRRC